jgi:hypothetical protein
MVIEGKWARYEADIFGQLLPAKAQFFLCGSRIVLDGDEFSSP